MEIYLELIGIGLIMFGFGLGRLTIDQKYAFKGVMIFALGVMLIFIGLIIGLRTILN